MRSDNGIPHELVRKAELRKEGETGDTDPGARNADTREMNIWIRPPKYESE